MFVPLSSLYEVLKIPLSSLTCTNPDDGDSRNVVAINIVTNFFRMCQESVELRSGAVSLPKTFLQNMLQTETQHSQSKRLFVKCMTKMPFFKNPNENKVFSWINSTNLYNLDVFVISRRLAEMQNPIQTGAKQHDHICLRESTGITRSKDRSKHTYTSIHQL